MAGRTSQRLACLILLLLAAAATARAEPLVGAIMSGNTPYFNEVHKAMLARLSADRGGELAPRVILQRPYPDPIALSNATRKLLSAEVDVIVTYGWQAMQAVLKEKSKVPVVFGGIYDPDLHALEDRNVTGCGYKVPLSSLLRYLRELKDIAMLSVIYTAGESGSRRQVEDLEELAAEQKIKLKIIDFAAADDLSALPGLISGDAVFLAAGPTIELQLDGIMNILKNRGLPSVCTLPDLNDSGVTVSLYQPPGDQGEKLAWMVGEVLAGKSPKTIKAETLRNTELAFNLREAKKMGIRIPFQLVAEAGKVIK